MINCKMIFNDLAQIQDRVKRMWASASNESDMSLLEYIEVELGNISAELRHRIDN